MNLPAQQSTPYGISPEQPDEGAGGGDDANLPQRLRSVYAKQTGAAEHALLLSWLAFGATFGLVRGITHALRAFGSGGSGGGGVTVAGRHLHHYNLGIVTLAAVGGVAIHGQEPRRRHPATSLAYGAGAALIVDELALLLDLKDVYWANDGRASVDAAVALVAGGGALIAAPGLWKSALREVARTRRGL